MSFTWHSFNVCECCGKKGKDQRVLPEMIFDISIWHGLILSFPLHFFLQPNILLSTTFSRFPWTKVVINAYYMRLPLQGDTQSHVDSRHKRQRLSTYQDKRSKGHIQSPRGTLSPLEQKAASVAFDLNLSGAEYERWEQIFPSCILHLFIGLCTWFRVAELVETAFNEGKESGAGSALSTNTLKKLKSRLHQDADPCSILVRMMVILCYVLSLLTWYWFT